MSRERRPRGSMEAQQMYVRGRRSLQVLRALPSHPRPKPVIAESEAQIYVDMRFDNIVESARAAGFRVGGRPEATEALRGQLREEIGRKYTVIPD